MLGVNVVVADTQEEMRQFTSVQQRSMLKCSFVGMQHTMCEDLDHFLNETGAKELIVLATLHDPEARLRSYELLATLWQGTC
jgi:alkanesulfonate monooxygenase SsuD/methylene tetrahydromethanopterin reductase-like flavin-dependent oxidoreductase (luciferase family)